MNFNETSQKNVTYDDIKSDLKNKALHFLQAVHFLKYILRVKAWIIFEWNLNISFCRITNLSFFINKNELRKHC